jgi:hypothetical protein
MLESPSSADRTVRRSARVTSRQREGAACCVALMLVANTAHAFVLPQLPYLGARAAVLPRVCCGLENRARQTGFAPRVCRGTGLQVSKTSSVEAVLELVKDTDAGANATALPPEKRKALYEGLDALESAAAAGGSDPLAPGGAAIGMWTVDFVGEADASSEVRQKKSSPAGGYWRGGICAQHARALSLLLCTHVHSC